MKINEFLQMFNVKCKEWEGNKTRPRVKCRDGYTVSVQAGYGTYSFPRHFSTYFSHVELGYPSTEDLELKPYAEREDDLLNTVYAMVPVELVDFILNKHGGIVDADYSNVKEGFWKLYGN